MRKSIYTVEQIDALLSAKGMAFQGAYTSVDEISAPVDGGHYYIGTEGAYSVYTYINGAWVNAGTLQGPEGREGPEGKPGAPFTYEDFTEEQLAALTGPAGYTPVKGVDYWTEKDKADMVDELDDELSIYATRAQKAAEDAERIASGIQDVSDDVEVAVAAALRAENAKESAESAAETAANEAVRNVETKLAGYVADAELAKTNAQSAAESAAQDAVSEVETEMAGYVSAAESAKVAAELARDEAKNIAGGDFLSASVYDPQGKKTDIFAYIEEHGGGKYYADDALDVATESGLVDPVTDENGAVFTDADGNIYSL